MVSSAKVVKLLLLMAVLIAYHGSKPCLPHSLTLHSPASVHKDSAGLVHLLYSDADAAKLLSSLWHDNCQHAILQGRCCSLHVSIV